MAGDSDVLGCEDLIILKLLAGRIIDKADAVALLEANTVDTKLLWQLADEAGVADELTAIQRELSHD